MDLGRYSKRASTSEKHTKQSLNRESAQAHGICHICVIYVIQTFHTAIARTEAPQISLREPLHTYPYGARDTPAHPRDRARWRSQRALPRASSLTHPPSPRAMKATQVSQDRFRGADGTVRAYAPCRGGGCVGSIPTPSSMRPGN
eukprot:1795912-Pleurochrysis_carterae.AAC.2